jgi:hypothetical protein
MATYLSRYMAENINEITCINIWLSNVKLIFLSTSKLSIHCEYWEQKI